MTAIALVFGSVLGFFGAIAGWVIWDASFVSAFGIYLGTAIGFTLFAAVTMAQTDASEDTLGDAQTA